MPDDYQKQRALEEARRKDERNKSKENLKKYSTGKNQGLAKNVKKDAQNLVKSATPWGALGFLMQASPVSDWMYGLALIAAIFKDILDIVEFTGIFYIIVIITTFLVSIFIAMMMLLGSFSNGYGKRNQKIIRSWLILLSGTAAEMLFGINILPIETLTVLIIYALALSARKQAKKNEYI
jgi:hypothetical protein